VLDGKRLADCKKENLLTDWLYECVLFAAVSGDLVCLKNMDAADCRLLRDSLHGLLLVAEEEGGEEYARHGLPHMVTMELKTPSTDEKVALWKAFLERFPHNDAIDPRTLGGKYVLNAGEIREVLFAAQNHANGLRREKIESGDIIWAIGQSQSGGLGSIAKPVECVFDWDDLIVEDAVKKQLEYICAQLKYRHLVGSEWGFYEKMPYGRGLSVLFYGPPGTGKTMAAQVIARETGLDLYRVDLSEMVSKYIGETEKNISRLFERARHMNVVLFFDEADAFFSKRSEVRDSHDRNANAEVAHLLQEMENYEGLTILATNRKDDMDDAFKRRIRLMLKFSFPSAETRQELWHSLLPEKTPRRENLALDFFAANFELSGSQIKDILLMAAFMAAKDGCVLGNEQIKEALCLNFQKYGKLLTEHDFEYLI
jgi:predicted nucleic acid-binding protein